MLRFESPAMFLLLLVVAGALYVHLRSGPPGALRFSSVAHARLAGKSLRQRLSALPLALRALALVLLTVALARPQMGTEQVRDLSRGIAIQMVLDRSSSMGGRLRYQSRSVNRLEVAKHLFEQFVTGDGGELEGRPADLIGLISFARYADTICPLTLSHDTLSDFLPTVKLARRQSEDGTAIGNAVALAAARLRTAEENLAEREAGEPDYEIKSKIIILLTDGENNAGKRSVAEAAQLAAEWGIKVYAVGIGGQGVSTIRTPFGKYSMPVGGGVDEEALRTLAERTGGMYRVAHDAEALREIYEEIDQLEKTEIESTRFVDYREYFPPFALAGLSLLGLEVLLAGTLFRRIP